MIGTEIVPGLNISSEELKEMQKIVKIETNGGDSDPLYRIFDPIQVTVEYCTGTGSGDTYGFSVFSSAGSWQMSRQIDAFFYYLNKRPLHTHDYFELVYVLEGSIVQVIEGKEYVYRAGTCFLLNRNVKHIERFIGAVKVFAAAVSGEFINEIIEEAPRMLKGEDRALTDSVIFNFLRANRHGEAGKEYLDLFPSPDNLNCAQDLTLLTGKLEEAIKDNGAGSIYYLKGAFCRLLHYMSFRMNATPVKLNTSADSLLFMRVQRLLENTDGRISRSEIAERLHYTGSYINDVVQKNTGMCLFDYGMTFCFAKAEEMLKKSNMSVSEICTELGFTNRTHFYSLFREHYGMTPIEYRKSISADSGIKA